MGRKSLFERLKVGLEEGIAHEKGEIELKVTEIVIPEPPKTYGSEDIKGIRQLFQMSQATFSRLLAVSKKTVEGWEQGVRTPTGSAARLLQFIEDPKLLEIRGDGFNSDRWLGNAMDKQTGNDKKTGAMAAGGTPKSKNSSKAAKTAAGSALSQKGSEGVTSAKAASKASQVLRSSGSPAKTRSTAGSALSQKPTTKSKSTSFPR